MSDSSGGALDVRAEQIKRELAEMNESTALRQMAIILGHWGVRVESYTPGEVCGAVYQMQRDLMKAWAELGKRR